MAIALSKEDVTAIAAELAAVDDDASWSRVLADATARVSESVFGLTIGKMAASYLAAHLMVVAQSESADVTSSTGGGGLGSVSSAVVKSITVGPVTTTYDVGSSSSAGGSFSSSSASEFSTPYGREYLRIVRNHSPRFFST